MQPRNELQPALLSLSHLPKRQSPGRDHIFEFVTLIQRGDGGQGRWDKQKKNVVSSPLMIGGSNQDSLSPKEGPKQDGDFP